MCHQGPRAETGLVVGYTVVMVRCRCRGKRGAQYGPPRELECDSEDYIRSLVLCVRLAAVLSLASTCLFLFFLYCISGSLALHYHFDPKWLYRCLEVFGHSSGSLDAL